MKNKLREEIESIKKRNRVFNMLNGYLEAKDYVRVEPDYFEDYEEFSKLNSRVKQESIVKLMSPAGRVIVLRPDITTNIIKQVIPYWIDGGEMKLFYNSTKFIQSANSLQLSRQFGAEYLGDESDKSDIEIIQLSLDIFNRFNDRFQIDLGYPIFIETLITKSDLSNQESILLKEAIMSKNSQDIITILDNRNSSNSTLLKNILSMTGTIEQVLSKIVPFKLDQDLMEILNYIQTIVEGINLQDREKINIDLSLLSQYDYYSGIVFQGYLYGLSQPILFGGRYDKLTKEFGKEIPAVGVSFDVSEYVKESKDE
jgi:ATP phosphoribosyltransferase regulatory subunit